MTSQDDNQADNNGGDVLNDRPLIVASNRGPVTFTRERDGTVREPERLRRRGHGGQRDRAGSPADLGRLPDGPKAIAFGPSWPAKTARC